jgi:acyl-ACP thioesterase
LKTRSWLPSTAGEATARSWTWADAEQVIEMGLFGPKERLIGNELIWVLVRMRLGFLRRREFGEVVDIAMVVGFFWVWRR